MELGAVSSCFNGWFRELFHLEKKKKKMNAIVFSLRRFFQILCGAVFLSSLSVATAQEHHGQTQNNNERLTHKSQNWK
ncbi:MAG: hypothetical protein HC880_02035 [Bacteroidia bacterium]|nr:hypothetical protein [Bacteroidia bacterium]